MKVRIFRFTIVAVIAMLGFALVGAMVSLAAPAEPAQDDFNTSPTLPADTEIQALRLISIPFGINDKLELVSEREIEVAGPGECREGDESFKLRVFVTQDGRSTQAKGRLEGDCNEVGEFTWKTTAEAQGRKTTFGTGPAHVRAMVVIFGSGQEADVGQWEKDVELVELE